MNSFSEILTSILKTVEENPSADIDELLAKKMSEMGVSEESINTLQETNSFLEAYDAMYAKLQAAKKDGDTNVEWVQGELLCIADKYNLTDEQKEELITGVSVACEDSLKTTLSKGE